MNDSTVCWRQSRLTRLNPTFIDQSDNTSSLMLQQSATKATQRCAAESHKVRNRVATIVIQLLEAGIGRQVYITFVSLLEALGFSCTVLGFSCTRRRILLARREKRGQLIVASGSSFSSFLSHYLSLINKLEGCKTDDTLLFSRGKPSFYFI
jgi:hypothetical protein